MFVVSGELMREGGRNSATPEQDGPANPLAGETAAQLQRVLQLNDDIRAHYRLAEDTIDTIHSAFDRIAAEYIEPEHEAPVAPLQAPQPAGRSKRPAVMTATLLCAAVGITTGLIVSLQAATPTSAPITSAGYVAESAITGVEMPAKAEDYGQTIYAARFSAAPPAERMCLARAVYYEARGEAMDGQVAVAQVILNRARSKQWPSTICSVVNQGIERGEKCQFSFACFTHLSVPNGQLWDRAKSVADEALAGRGWLRELIEATHYHTTSVLPVWRLNLTPINTIGSHIFYRGNDGIVASSKDADGYRKAAAAQTVKSVHEKIAAAIKATSAVKVAWLANGVSPDTSAAVKVARPKTAANNTPAASAPKRSAAQAEGDWKASVFGQ